MNAKATVPIAFLLITPFQQSLFRDDSCLRHSFYGNVQDGPATLSVFQPHSTCLDIWLAETPALSGSIVEAPAQENRQLVWLREVTVDESLRPQTTSFSDNLYAFLDSLPSTLSETNYDVPQQVIKYTPSYELLFRSPTAALISVDNDIALAMDVWLPAFWKSIILPGAPVSFIPVSSDAEKRVAEVLHDLKLDPVIASIVHNLSTTQMRDDVRFLTGEDGKSSIRSRHSFSTGARIAAGWLKERFEETGADCELKPFLFGFAPNVVCRYSPMINTTATIVLGAHYDSRGSFGSLRAPGANDDGSGTISLLAIARTIAKKHIKFHSNVELVAFAGEEQGLLGSRAYARYLRGKDANVTMMIQADMIAYRAPGEPRQLGLPDLIGSPRITQLVANVSYLYSPELQVGFTPACCSDHQSFHEQGYPATQVFERAGPIADPMYHNSGDLSQRIGYDFEQLRSISKVQFAALLHTAGFEQEK